MHGIAIRYTSTAKIQDFKRNTHMKNTYGILYLLLILFLTSTGLFSQGDDVYFKVSATQFLEDVAREKAIFGLDVFTYYDLNRDHPDETAKKSFMKTDEYKGLLRELKEIKASHSEIEFKTWLDFHTYFHFDEKSKEFRIPLTENTASAYSTPPKTITDIHIPKLPTKWIKDESGLFEKAQKEVFVFKVDIKTTELIKKNNLDIRVYLLFKPKGVKTVNFSVYREAFGEWKQEQESANMLYTDQVRIIVMNNTTSEVYFDKIYK